MGFLNYRNYGRLWAVYGRSVMGYSTPKKILNAFRTEIAYRRRTSDVRSAPFILFLEPLYYCNLECPLCDRQIFPDARQGDQAGKLSLELYDRILDEVGDYLYQCQIFGQGEPLMDWPRTQAIIEKSHARRIFTLVSTNCTLATPQIADEIVRSGLDHLVCAIDGLTQETYAQYRAGGHIEDAMGGLHLFVNARNKARSKMKIEWQFLHHKGNLHEIEDARRLAKKLGVFFRASPLRGMDYDPLLQEAWLPPKLGRQEGDFKLGETAHSWPCYFLWRSLVLNSNHKVARCLVYQNVAEYADLNEVTVLEAFNHASVQRARQLFSKKPVAPGEFPAPCNNCSFYARTHGGPNLDKPASLGRPAINSQAFVPLESLRITPRRTHSAQRVKETV